ncbi:MAG: penicillin-binding protein, partial [Gemmatimonadales bacterium]
MASRSRSSSSRLRAGFFAVASAFRRPWVWVPVLAVLAIGLGFAWGAWRNLCVDCPSIAQIHTWEPQQTSKVMSRDGRLISELGIERRTPVPIDALPEHVPQAFKAVEDRRFHRHRGIDLRGTSRAVLGVFLTRGFQGSGGSTITQQLARNMFTETIGFEKRVERKLKELQVALELERAYSKDQILEAYMNQIFLSEGYGIQSASRNFFGKDAIDLNPAEAAMLAAIANRPNHFSPFRNPDAALSRRNLVLGLMGREGFLSSEEVEEWRAHPLPETRARRVDSEAPYFTEWVRQIVQSRFGSQVYTGGLQI